MAKEELMAQLLLLPDEVSLPRADQGLGMVSMPAGKDAPQETGKAMRPGGGTAPLTSVSDRLQEDPARLAHWRGLMAFVLLCDTWQDAPVLRSVAITAGTSGFAKAVLQAANLEVLRLCVLGIGPEARVLGIEDSSQMLRLPATRQDLSRLVPARVTWYDRETHAFRDPCDELNDRDRLTLMARLSGMEVCPHAKAFRADLLQAGMKLTQSCVDGPDTERWRVCLRAVVGLAPELKDDTVSILTPAYFDRPTGNALLQSLGLGDAELPAFRPQRIWQWKGVPFAVTQETTGMRPLPGFDFSAMQAECVLMEQTSPRYARDLSLRLQDWMTPRLSVLPEEGKKKVMRWISEARLAALQTQKVLALNYPWDEGSPAIRLLLRELLGEELSAAAVAPFSDRLCLIPGGSLGDQKLQQRCALIFGTDIYTAVPPVSPVLVRYMSSHAWSDHGVAVDTLSFAAEDEGIRVSVTLQGAGKVCITRHYAADEVILMEGTDVPRVSLFPSVPIADDRWKLFYLSVWGNVDVAYPDEGEWHVIKAPIRPVKEDAGQAPAEAPAEAATETPGERPAATDDEKAAGAEADTEADTEGAPATGSAPAQQPASPAERECRVVRMHRLPPCVALMDGDVSLGALVFRATPCYPPEAGPAVAALDVGASGTAMAMTLGGRTMPVALPCLWHVLLHGAQDDISNEALPVSALGPVIPSAVILRNGVGDEPLLDGHVCLDAQLDGLLASRADVVYDLLWRNDDEADRARRLLWRESMLLCAFHAVMCGAKNISWRIILPHGMAYEGRKRLLEEVRRTAEWLAPESGLPLTFPGQEPLGLRETMSAGLQLRDTGLMRSGFAMVNVGGSGTDLSLWLRGINRPAVECHVNLGTSAMLMESLLMQPDLLQTELAALNAPAGMLLSRGTVGVQAWSANRLLLDQLTGPHLQETMGLMNLYASQGRMTRVQALLLLGFAQLMTLTGVSLQQVRENAMLNDYLPPELTVQWTGRGRDVLTAMSPALTQSMVSFIRLAMEPAHPVRSMRMSCEAEGRMAGVYGLAKLKNLPDKASATISSFGTQPMPMLQLCARFLAQFDASYPQATALLFPGMMSTPGYFTLSAQHMITRVVQQSSGPVQERFMNCIREIRLSCAAPVTEGQEDVR